MANGWSASAREGTNQATRDSGTGTVSGYEWMLLAVFFAILGWSAIRPFDYFTWLLEVLPAIIALGLIVSTYRRFPLTRLILTLVLIHAIILMIGGHYSYAKVPLFDWVREYLHQSRNNYDRVGHFMQGFVPAMVAREVLLRKNVVRGKVWLFFIVLCICGAVSAMYELFEWSVAIASGTAADAFLGSQGDPWDTQEDMACAFVGAITSQIFFNGWHNRQLLVRRFMSDKVH